MQIEINNKERLCLLQCVRSDIAKANMEKEPSHVFVDGKYVKPRRKYGIGRLTNLYSLESKLLKNNK